MILLVRHAVPFFPRVGGPDDHHRPLTAEGARQARRLARQLPAPALVVSSPYLRAVQTVEPLARAHGHTVTTDPALREWDSGVGPSPDYARLYEESWSDPGLARPGGESLDQLTVRARDAVTALAARPVDGTIVVGSHGTFIARALLGIGVPGIDWPFCASMPMPAVYRLHPNGDRILATGPGLINHFFDDAPLGNAPDRPGAAPDHPAPAGPAPVTDENATGQTQRLSRPWFDRDRPHVRKFRAVAQSGVCRWPSSPEWPSRRRRIRPALGPHRAW